MKSMRINIGSGLTLPIGSPRKPARKNLCGFGTIFEDSPLGLDKWFVAAWSIANAKNGISSMELHRALGVTQKTAWFMLHRIRVAMTTRTFRKLSGEVESDETFLAGKAKNMHDDLARKLVAVPKKELARRLAQRAKRKAERKKKK